MMREIAKALARQIPAVDRLIKQRDDLLREVEALRRQAANHAEDQPSFDRRELITGHLNLDGLGLEIGPGHSRLWRKRPAIEWRSSITPMLAAYEQTSARRALTRAASKRSITSPAALRSLRRSAGRVTM